MEIIGWVRQGDKAACGGIVCEGDQFVTSLGRPYTFQAAKVACKKGTCTIVEGYAFSTLMNDRPQVLHGMKTSSGCPLLSTLNDNDGVSNDPGDQVATSFFQNADGYWTPVLPPAPGEDAYDEQVKMQHRYAEGLPYFIETLDGRTFSGRIGPDGLLPRVTTHGEDEYTILWGDEALANMEQAHV